MDKIVFNKLIIEADFIKSEGILLDKGKISIIKYSNFDHTTFDTYNQDLLNDVSGQPIVYCIWTGASPTALSAKYIGHAGNKISRQHVRAHLTKKNEKTGAQLYRIKEILEQKNVLESQLSKLNQPICERHLKTG